MTDDRMHHENDPADARVGDDPQRPADNMVLDYDPMVDPGTVVGPAVDPNAENDHDDAAPDDAERPAASMSMTKAELLDRLHESASGQTKAQILGHIQRIEGADAAAPADEMPPRVYSNETRSFTIDGQTRTWTEASEDQVPEAYREGYAQSRAAGGV